MFKLFGKLDDTNKVNTSGVGLGLNICKLIVEIFDGKLYLDETRDQDSPVKTKFTFEIIC